MARVAARFAASDALALVAIVGMVGLFLQSQEIFLRTALVVLALQLGIVALGVTTVLLLVHLRPSLWAGFGERDRRGHGLG